MLTNQCRIKLFFFLLLFKFGDLKAQPRDFVLIKDFFKKNIVNYNKLTEYQKSDSVKYKIDTSYALTEFSTIYALEVSGSDFVIIICIINQKDVLLLNFGQRGSERPVLKNYNTLMKKEKKYFEKESDELYNRFIIEKIFPETICLYEKKENSVEIINLSKECKLPIEFKSKQPFVAYNMFSMYTKKMYFSIVRKKSQSFKIKIENGKNNINRFNYLIDGIDRQWGIYPIFRSR